MNIFLKMLCVALFLASCQKTVTSEKEVNTAVVASNATKSSINCHSISFTSDYPVRAGEVPPFSFTKTLYPDARVGTIKMLSRAYPIHPAYPKHAVELNGTFTYAANMEIDNDDHPHNAFLKGTSEVWEYYRMPNGTGSRRSISKRNVNYIFYINPQGHCEVVQEVDNPDNRLVIFYGEYAPFTVRLISKSLVDKAGNRGGVEYFFKPDAYGNLKSMKTARFGNLKTDPYYPAVRYDLPMSLFRVNYDYTKGTLGKNYNYIPSQNLICQEYSLLEVMQWLPTASHERSGVDGIFFPPDPNSTEYPLAQIFQNQVYKNFKFDAKGNQISVTYGDNILQKTTWSCQN